MQSLPVELWKKVAESLLERPDALSSFAHATNRFEAISLDVVKKYEAHLHITYPNEECCNQQQTSSRRVEFEMILNRKIKYRNGVPHHHSVFSCTVASIDITIENLLRLFSEDLITIRFNNFPSKCSCFSIFNKFHLPRVDDICFHSCVPTTNGIFDLFQSCSNFNRLVISNPPEDCDFSLFWPHLKGSRVEALDLLDINHFSHSCQQEFRLPSTLKRLFFCPAKDSNHKFDALARLLYSTTWNKIYIHSDEALTNVLKNLYKPIPAITEFCFSSSNFALNSVAKFLTHLPRAQVFNWYGLQSCVAPIVIARLLKDLKRSIVFGGGVACKSGHSVSGGRFIEVSQRIGVVEITKLLEQPSFSDVYGSFLDDAVLFKKPFTTSAVTLRSKIHEKRNLSSFYVSLSAR